MTDQLEFPQLKQAYLQSLPSEQAILARMRAPRPAVTDANSHRGLYTFGFAGAVCLAALVIVIGSNDREPQAQLSAEPLQPTSVGAKAGPAQAVSLDFAAIPRDVVDDESLERERAIINQPHAPKTNRRKAPADAKVNPTAYTGAKATWSEVGILLRNGKEAEAQSKIAELAQSDDLETREGALLFQLRQKVQAARKTGTAVEPTVRVDLRKLAVGGSTSSVRLTAKRLLGELD